METVSILEQALSGLLGRPLVTDLVDTTLDCAGVLMGFTCQLGNRVAEPKPLPQGSGDIRVIDGERIHERWHATYPGARRNRRLTNRATEEQSGHTLTLQWGVL